MFTILSNQSSTSIMAIPQTPLDSDRRLVERASLLPNIELTAAITHVRDNLRHFFQTDYEVLCFPGTDTAGMETAVINLFSPGDHVAVISIGDLGDHFANVALLYGLTVEKIEFPWGEAADPQIVAQRIRNISGLRGVCSYMSRLLLV